MTAIEILASRKLLDELEPFHLIWCKSGPLEHISEKARAYFECASTSNESTGTIVYLLHPFHAVMTLEIMKGLGQSTIKISHQPKGSRVLSGRLLDSEGVGGWLFVGTPENVDDQMDSTQTDKAVRPDGVQNSSKQVRWSHSESDFDVVSDLSPHSERQGRDDKRPVYNAPLSQLELESTLGELKRTQATLVQQERLKAVGEMVRGIAHDFSNILTPISAYSWLLKSHPEVSPAERDEYVDLIMTATKDAHALIERLRRLYNPASSSATYSSFDINGLIKETLRLAEPRWADQLGAESQSVEIVESLQSVGLMTAVESDIRQALLNLLYNAADAIKKNGVIAVESISDEQRIWISICDDGSGMNPEVLETCATPFFTTKGDAGTGLGLPMVFETAVRHGGDVRIESELGHGTRVTLCLPRQPLENGASEIHATSTAIAARLVTRVGLDAGALATPIGQGDGEHHMSDSDVLDALFEAALDPNMVTQEVMYPPGAFALEQTASMDVQSSTKPKTSDPSEQQALKSDDTLHILVVDDDEAILNVLSRIIDTHGHTSYTAENGSQALVLADRLDFDLVICDLDMPGMKGDQLCLSLKQLSPRAKLIMFTGNPDGIVPDARHILDAIVTKPNSPVDVLMAGIDLVYSGRNTSN
ncbi:MAG: ATP-binding protein [Myxococcota bacterium]|nr:ATP-binding protein [Myxococcota bacterium]